jgi:hypothetical protein
VRIVGWAMSRRTSAQSEMGLRGSGSRYARSISVFNAGDLLLHSQLDGYSFDPYRVYREFMIFIGIHRP